MNVLYLDGDEEFRERFSSYIASEVEGLVITTGSGNEDEKLLEAILEKEPDGYDLILADESAKVPDRFKKLEYRSKTVVLTADDRRNMSAGNDGVRFVFKYQRVSSLISSVPELAAAAASAVHMRTENGMEIVLVTGYGGGCGRTSFALMYARLLKRMAGRSALILSAERTSDINDYFRVSKDRSDINLLLLNFSSGISVLPQRFIAMDDYGASAFVMPEDAVSDFGDLSPDMMLKFTEMIGEWKMFDTLIVDMNSQLSGVCAPVVKAADRVFIVHSALKKTHRSERAWSDLIAELCGGEVRHVLNFSSAAGESNEIFVDESAEQDNDYGFSCVIPSDPESFFIREGCAEISMTGGFSQAVGSIVDEV